MKIGILTLHYIPNMGAVLQAYATQKIFEKLLPNDIVEIIDYRSDNREYKYSLCNTISHSKKSKNIMRLIRLPYDILLYQPLYRLRKTLENFYNEEMNLSNQFSKGGLLEEQHKYDVIIIGSDQVWNPYIVDEDYTYLLDFYQGEKFNYASSIGLEVFPEKYKKIYSILLKSFKFISCRESRGAEILSDLTNHYVKEVLDPTLLITKVQWVEFAQKSKIKKIKLPYICVYMVNFSERMKAFAEKLKQEMRYEIIYISTPAFEKNLRKENAVSNITPYDWISLIYDAAFVVTNSFHGIAFSLNLNKQVFIETESKQCLTMSRLCNIVSNFKLEDHVLTDESLNDFLKNTKPIDYDSVNKILFERRNESYDYLQRIIDEIKLSNSIHL